MKRIFFVLLITALTCIQSLAIPAHPGMVKMPQPDGTLLTIQLVGDEFYHFNTTADGYTIMLTEAGSYVYAQRDGMSLKATNVLAHDEGERTPAEMSLLAGLSKYLVDETDVAEGHVRRAKRDVELSGFDYENFRGLVILIDFSNKSFASTDPKTFYSNMFNTAGFTGYYDPITARDVSCPGSVYDYFVDQSDGAFTPSFDVYGPYRARYGQNGMYEATANQCDNLSSTIFTNALRAADADVDFTRYDINNDGKIDMVYFLVAGYSSSFDGNNSGYLWPHASNLGWTYGYYDNKLIDRYASSTELYGFESSPNTVTVEGIGTVCHEFSHVLGLPDFYDTDYRESGGQSHHPGGWDLMAGGGDYNYGRSPCGYTLFERYALGWSEVTTIDHEGAYELEAVNTGRTGYILRSPVNNEYFTIENRQKTGWDYYLPGHGMIVTRVDSTNASVWSRNKINCNPAHNYFEMLRAGNTTEDDLPSDPFPGTLGNVMLTNETAPNLQTWGGYANDFNIINIREKDGLVTFNVVEDGHIVAIVEDFESMPVTTSTSEKNVEGKFANWSFNKAGVRAPGPDKANGENSVIMETPSLMNTVTPVYYNIYLVGLTVFNPVTTVAKYSLEYSVENDDDGNPVWILALDSRGKNNSEVAGKTVGTCYWYVDLNNTQPALFRIREIAGKKTYIDDVTLYYTGEPGSPSAGLEGDVNNDNEVNILDVDAIIGIILNGSSAYAEDLLKRADVNDDEEINIMDVDAVISIILKN